jgi:hypothetical protein
MKALAEIVNELNLLIKQFRFEEALDKFYDMDAILVENENPPVIGLSNYRVRAKNFITNTSNYSAELLNLIVSDNMSVTEWHYKFDHKEWGRWDRVQLSLQRWKDGRIVHERHHYSTT